jgi:hypothetical protein
MSWRFRKIFSWGPFRTTWTKRGWGFSWGIPGFRYGVTPDGRRYISIGIPRTGLYWIKYLDHPSNQQLPKKDVETKPLPLKKPRKPDDPWWEQKELKDK